MHDPGGPDLGRSWALRIAVPAIAVSTLAAAAWDPSLGLSTSTVDARVAQAGAEAGASVVSVLVGVLFLLHAHVADRNVSSWVGVSLLLLGAVTFGVGSMLPLMDPAATDETIAPVRVGSRLAVGWLLLFGLWTSRRNERWRRRPTRLLLVAGVALAGIPLGLQLFALDSYLLTASPDGWQGDTTLGSLVALTMWSLVAIGYAVAGLRGRSRLLLWVAVLAGAFAGASMSELSESLAFAATKGWTGGGHLLRTAGLLCATGGVAAAIVATLRRQRGSLLSRAEVAEAHARSAQHELRASVHEARNALAGIVGALRTLEEHGDALDARTHRELSTAVFAEMVRLQHLFAPAPGGGWEPFRIAEAVAPVVTAMRAQGLDVHEDVPAALTAYGNWSQTAQAVQNLLENARRHAPGGAVELTASNEGDRTVIRVADRGQGVAAWERDRIFEPGERGASSTGVPGTGLGLSITRDLVGQQGGRVWVEGRDGGGAVFVIALPADEPGQAAPRSSSDRVAQPVDQRDDSMKVVDLDPLDAPVGGHGGHARAGRHGGQGQGDPGRQTSRRRRGDDG